MENKRLLYIDQLRGIVMLLVVIVHLCGKTNNTELQSFMNIIGNFRMPLFFFVSGYIINKVTKIYNFKDLFRFYKKKAIALLVPCVVWTLIVNNFFFTNTPHIPTLYEIQQCFSNDGHLWFLTTLFQYMIAVGIFRYFILSNKTNYAIITLVIYFALMAFLFFEFGFLRKSTLYFPYFTIGLITSAFTNIENIIRKNITFIISVLLFCLFSGYWVSGQTSIFNVSVRAISAMTAIIALFNFVTRLTWEKYTDKVIRKIGVNTLSVT